jgi:ElaB/YqjD/DUF883 family membrane-anchored ribosome-binding protein
MSPLSDQIEPTKSKGTDMSATMPESKSGANETTDVRQEIQDLRKSIEVQTATQAGANATQAATHAGTWSTMVAGSAGLIVGIFLALAFAATSRS